MEVSSAFTPGRSLVGGLLIGASSSLFLYATGRIAGISGILGGFTRQTCTPAVDKKKNDDAVTCAPAVDPWRAAFLAGLFSGGIALNWAAPEVFGSVDAQARGIPALLGGLLVGFGTQLGSGCTSGHGVCGLARMSIRSLVAVCSFMCSGMLSAAFLRPLVTSEPLSLSALDAVSSSTVLGGVLSAGMAYLALKAVNGMRTRQGLVNSLASFGCGSLFALGLGVSGMTDPEKVTAFLAPPALGDFSSWDPSLMFVMGGAAGFNLLTFRFILPSGDRACKPVLGDKFFLPTKQHITVGLVLGSALFGAGWGMAGICPGPGLVGFTTLQSGFGEYMVGLLGGIGVFEVVDRVLALRTTCM